MNNLPSVFRKLKLKPKFQPKKPGIFNVGDLVVGNPDQPGAAKEDFKNLYGRVCVITKIRSGRPLYLEVAEDISQEAAFPPGICPILSRSPSELLHYDPIRDRKITKVAK